MSQAEKEIRNIADQVELRAADDGTSTIAGYAAMFNTFSEDLGGFREIIRPGAFTNALASGGDVRALVDHDDSRMLGRTSSGTLRLAQDDKGLRYEVTTPDTSYARDLVALLKRGDVTKSSFAFTVPDDGDQWRKEGNKTIRELHNVNLFDVSPVTSYPAYNATSAGLRSLQKFEDGEKAKELEAKKGIEPVEAEKKVDLDILRRRVRVIELEM